MFFKGKHNGKNVDVEISDADVLKKIAQQEARLKSLETASTENNVNYSSDNTEFDIDEICRQLLNNEIEL